MTLLHRLFYAFFPSTRPDFMTFEAMCDLTRTATLRDERARIASLEQGFRRDGSKPLDEF